MSRSDPPSYQSGHSANGYLQKEAIKAKIKNGGEGGIDSNRLMAILTLKGAFGVQNANAFCDSSLRSSPLQGALRASKIAKRFCDSSFRELPAN